MKSRTNPACGTCRKKCRKCDRARPVCNRCRVKGLHCEGYPPRFLFFQDQLNSKGQEQNNPVLSSKHQLSALQSLSSLLMKEEIYGLTDDEQDVLLAVVILLVLYDICETGVSSHGVHLTGAGYICGKLARQPKVVTSPRTTFLLTALAWLDVLRAFSGAEKLAYSDNVRRCILEADHFNLETLVGCPVELFYEIGCTVQNNTFASGTLRVSPFRVEIRSGYSSQRPTAMSVLFGYCDSQIHGLFPVRMNEFSRPFVQSLMLQRKSRPTQHGSKGYCSLCS
ncbi:fungal-specific transcription factor domain-containing protein [Aspergillus transmontanensis]|uniref:Fungal-specific transcription factor domain-containing protein n=1 Tax=Aspergillus transmontanensis TaxID=1034304 RepID=A0A5N6VW71_9EURO|nr:fungal-specific transcription factor domain-containing protein [Aspergillus transmontanensis]